MQHNMSGVVKRFSKPYTAKRITQAVVNHRPTEQITEVAIKAVVQSASPTLLNVLDVDTSLRYYQVHTCDSVADGDIIVISAAEYRLTKGRDFTDYGYREFIAEEIKQ